MKILIIRTYPDELNIKNYNCQELGLAKALVKQGNICDIVLYTSKNENYEEIINVDERKKIHIYYLRAKKFLKNVFFDKRDLENIVKDYDIVQVAEYDQIGNMQIKKLSKKMVIYHGPYSSKYTKGYNLKCKISDFIYLFNKDYKNTDSMWKRDRMYNIIPFWGPRGMGKTSVMRSFLGELDHFSLRRYTEYYDNNEEQRGKKFSDGKEGSFRCPPGSARPWRRPTPP